MKKGSRFYRTLCFIFCITFIIGFPFLSDSAFVSGVGNPRKLLKIFQSGSTSQLSLSMTVSLALWVFWGLLTLAVVVEMVGLKRSYRNVKIWVPLLQPFVRKSLSQILSFRADATRKSSNIKPLSSEEKSAVFAENQKIATESLQIKVGQKKDFVSQHPVPSPVEIERSNPNEYVTVEGDSWFSLAENFYGNGAKWKALREANAGRCCGDTKISYQTEFLEQGWNLTIPSFVEERADPVKNREQKQDQESDIWPLKNKRAKQLPILSPIDLGVEFSIDLLGPVRIDQFELSGKEVPWNDAKTPELIALLASRRNSLNEKVLLKLLWPDEHDGGVAKKNFKSTLSEVRRVLSSSHSGSPRLLFTPEGYTFHSSVGTDIDIFDHYVLLSEQAKKASDLEKEMGLLNVALRLVRGEPLSNLTKSGAPVWENKKSEIVNKVDTVALRLCLLARRCGHHDYLSNAARAALLIGSKHPALQKK